MRRIMGTEVEYGIAVPGDATANPVLTSTQVVLAYAAAADIPRARRARWDYEVESPLRDARGFDLGAPGMPPSDPEVEDLGDANLAELSTYLKVGTAALVLDLIESGIRFDHLKLADPVRAVHTISHDPT